MQNLIIFVHHCTNFSFENEMYKFVVDLNKVALKWDFEQRLAETIEIFTKMLRDAGWEGSSGGATPSCTPSHKTWF